MCRQNQLFGWMLVCFGAGLLLGTWIASVFLGCCMGVAAVAAGAKRSVTLPVVPRRCDHFRLRLTGTGAWRLQSLAYTQAAAGPQH